DAGSIPGDAGGARGRKDRSRDVSAAVRGARGKTGEGPKNLRWQIWHTVRGGVDRPDREGRIPEKECACDARVPRRSQSEHAVLSRKAARGPAAPDRS